MTYCKSFIVNKVELDAKGARVTIEPPNADNCSSRTDWSYMVQAKKQGIIKSTNKIARSIRPGTHGNRHTVWRSRYFGESK